MTDLADQLAQLHEERKLLAGSIQDDDEIIGDMGDQAETLERVNSLNALDERILEITRLLEDHQRQPLRPSGETVEPGTRVTLRFDDGSSETVDVVRSIFEENDADPVLTPDSPVGRAVLGSAAGERVSYDSADGPREVEVVQIERSAQA